MSCDQRIPLPESSTPGCLTLNEGDIVRFLVPSSEDEANERFLVLEKRGDRVLVEAVCDMRLKPTFVYLAADLVLA